MTESELCELILVAENADDWAALEGLFADDVTIVHPGVGAIHGRDNNLAFIKFYFGTIDGHTRRIEDLIVADGRAAFRFIISGTYVGGLPDYPATSDEVEVCGAMFTRFADDQLVFAQEMLDHDSIRGISTR